MTSPDRRIIVGIHGWWGAGKTWLAHTLPGPRLVLDTEGGSKDVAFANVRSWDPMTEPVPTDLGPEDSIFINIRDFGKAQAAMSLLQSGNHPFESVILDSFTEMQALLKEKVANPGHEYDPGATFDFQAWGRLKNFGGLLIRDLRDLTWDDSPKPVNVAVVMGSDTENIPARPLLEGGLRKQLLGFFDLFGYLFTAQGQDGTEVRVLQIASSSTAEAKCRLHMVKSTYGTHIENPNLSAILAATNTKETTS